MPAERFSQTLRGMRPRARMSSENEVSFEKFFSTRAHDEGAGALAPHQQAFFTRPSIALRTVMRETSSSVGEIALRRQRVVGAEHAPLDRVAKRALQLLVQRQAARVIECAKLE